MSPGLTWKFYWHWRTRTKVVSAFMLLCAVVSAGWVVNQYAVRDILGEVTAVADHWLPRVSSAKEMQTQLASYRAQIFRHLVFDAPAQKQAVWTEAQAVEAQFLAAADRYRAALTSEEERAQLDELRRAWVAYRAVVADVIDASSRGARDEAFALIKARGVPVQQELARRMQELVDASAQGAAASAARAAVVQQRAFRVMLGIMALVVLFGLLQGLWVADIIARPLRRAVQALNALAKGDLTRTLSADTRDELGDLARAFNEATQGLRASVGGVRAIAQDVAGASSGLSSSSKEISSGAQTQAVGIEQAAARLSDLTQAVEQSAQSAERVRGLSDGARQTASRGRAVMADAMGAMAQLRESSGRIRDIIGTIDELSFQTNLLALNAAVEAARAGEQGRGFAVVAGEVRALAGRSAQAAKEVRALIGQSVSRVEDGAALVRRSEESLDALAGAVNEVADLVTEMAAASKRQSGGISELNRAVAQVNDVTRSNAAQTEELSATSERLSAEAEELRASVALFTVEEDGGLRA